MAKKDKKSKGQNPKSTEGAKTESKAAKAETKKSEKQVTTGGSRRNVAVATGIAILIILALLAFAFFIASLSNDTGENGTNDTTQSESTDDNQSQDNDDQNDNDSDSDNGDDNDQDSGNNQGQNNGSDNDQDDRDDQDNNNSDNDNTDNESNNDGDTDANDVNRTFRYSAGRGDSVSTLARRAINDYLNEADMELDNAKRLFWEVNLTNSSNPQWLDIGESRTFDADLMNDLYQQAKDLGGQQHANWLASANAVGYR